MKVAFLGDIAFLGNFSIINNPKVIESLKSISTFLSKFDVVIANLETPFSIKKKTFGAKSSYICADIANIDVLKALHIDGVSLANNHMYDFGQEGFETTIRVLEKAGIHWFGANGKDFKIEIDENKVVINGFCCYSTNPLNIATAYGELGINRFNIGETFNILKTNHEKGWLNVIAVHSGIEHVNRPSVEQIKISRMFADVVPYIWYGHHPHVVQGVESYNESLIAHSVGNFCFAGNLTDKNRPTVELSENNRIGMILEVEIEENKIKNWQISTIYIEEDGVIRIIDKVDQVKQCSKYLKNALLDQSNYQMDRLKQRNCYLNKRKEMRNLSWFLKRLRPRYFKLLLDNQKNVRRYRQNVMDFLDD